MVNKQILGSRTSDLVRSRRLITKWPNLDVDPDLRVQGVESYEYRFPIWRMSTTALDLNFQCQYLCRDTAEFHDPR